MPTAFHAFLKLKSVAKRFKFNFLCGQRDRFSLKMVEQTNYE